MQKILITGINGFLGSHLAKSLSAEFLIIGTENSTDNNHRIPGCEGKIYSSKEDDLETIFSENNIYGIIHTASVQSRDPKDYQQVIENNLVLPINLLNHAIKHGCKWFINSDTVLDRFTNAYALSKRHFQEWLYLRKREIKIINMELELFYGPGASASNFITGMISRLKNNEPNIELSLGEQIRNFVYIDDIVKAYLIILKSLNQNSNPYSSYHLCTNQLVTIKELMILLKQLTGSNSKLDFGALPYRDNELMSSGHHNQAITDLGWQPQYTLLDGLLKTI